MNSLNELFYQLISIPSPSGEELNVGNFIKKYLENINIKANFDNTGIFNQSNSGNLIAKLGGDKDLPTVLFVAHMDTVENGEEIINPRIDNGIIKSNGNTILGADNKASVACLLLALEEVKKIKNHPTIIAVFTTREEKGEMGVKYLNLKEKIDYVFNLDGKGRIGTFIYKTLGQVPFSIEIIGKSAHAAIEPEKGVNAIKAASLIISSLKIGKDKKGNTLNIGTIHGGEAVNIVPKRVLLEGELRAFTNEDLNKNLSELKKVTKSVCHKFRCSFKIAINEKTGAPPMYISKNHPIITLAKNATKSMKLPFFLEVGSFTSEANYLAQKYSVINVCRGGKMPHSTRESVKVNELITLKDLIIKLSLIN